MSRVTGKAELVRAALDCIAYQITDLIMAMEPVSYTHLDVYKRQALPIALQNFLSTTASMVDTIMIGSQGELSVAAVGICSQISSLFFSCYFGFAGGSLLFFSQYWGAAVSYTHLDVYKRQHHACGKADYGKSDGP